jgi:acyl dehydratase
VPGLWYEQFQPGAVLEHATRLRVTQEDNAAFCRLTLNRQPLHLDRAAAKKAGFRDTLVNGLYTFSATVGASVEDTTAGTLLANLGYQDVEHPQPVFPGDTLTFRTEVVEKRPSSKPGRGVVTLLHRALNQEGTEVCRFKRTVMVLTKPEATP